MLKTAGICFLMLLMGAVSNYADPVRDAYNRVKTRVLAHPYAVNNIPPKVGITDSVYIRINFVPYQILFVNEAEMTVTVAATLTLEWDEPAFAWNPALQDNITLISVSRNDIWTPRIINSKTIDSADIFIDMPKTLLIDFLGTVRTMQMLTLTVSCSFDMEWYPLDSQTCSFDFIPFNGESASINTVALGCDTSVDGVMVGNEKTEWSYGDVKATQIDSYLVGEECWVAKNLTYTSFQVSMERKSTYFYLTNVIFPVSASAILVLGVFCIPPSSGEKISYLVSIFISMTVFLSSVSSKMSKGQGKMCRFNVLIAVITMKIIFATAASIFVLRRYSKEQEEKEEEVTSLTPIGEERDSASLNFENLNVPVNLSRELGLHIDTANHKLDKSGLKERRKSDAMLSPQVISRVDASERSFSTSTDLQSSGTSRLQRKMLAIRRYFKKGKRFTSAELDNLFFMIFTVTSISVYVLIMHTN